MERLVVLILVVGLFGMSFGAPLARFVPELAAMTIAFWRMFGASLVMWSSAPFKQERPLEKNKLPTIMIAGFFLGLHFVCFYAAVKMVPIANATLFATLAPIFTIAYERFGLKRHLPTGAVLGLWIAVGGALVIQISGLNFELGETAGNLMALASSLFMSVVLILGERVRASTSMIAYTRWLYLFAAISIALVTLITGTGLGFSLPDAKWLIGLVILPTLIGHNSMNFAVKYLRPTIVGAAPFGEPILASLIAWFLFGESVGIYVAIGGGITISGLIILTLNRK
ncbi:MAG: DMT family transporter [Candidatus Marinimicrobia bacterium]|nr:DMT family transporter [Candidatus Neomarinimicrobiota bacterium]MCF7904360.1 DMT family transporter [Candidatus Neomarinimicrobiota bacterium]